MNTLRISLLSSILAFAIGCSSSLNPENWVPEPADHAMSSALLAKYTALDGTTPSLPSGPKVGDKCPTCNDPPSKCGVGKVGDGTVCMTCGECNGDGRIDERDLNKSTAQTEFVEMQKEFVGALMAAKGPEPEDSTEPSKGDGNKVCTLCPCGKATCDGGVCECTKHNAVQDVSVPTTKIETPRVKAEVNAPSANNQTQTIQKKPAVVTEQKKTVHGPALETKSVAAPVSIVYPTIIEHTSDSCPPCVRFKNNVKPRLVNGGVQFAKGSGYSGPIPYFEIFDRDGNHVANHTGYMTVEQFEAYIGHNKSTKTKTQTVSSQPIVMSSYDLTSLPNWDVYTSRPLWGSTEEMTRHLRGEHRVPENIIQGLTPLMKKKLHTYLHERERAGGSRKF